VRGLCKGGPKAFGEGRDRKKKKRKGGFLGKKKGTQWQREKEKKGSRLEIERQWGKEGNIRALEGRQKEMAGLRIWGNVE